ncbi:hypothetical protein K439DRAFT_1633729 [Ramaria rubella]|nr:hypothetical protein K439DRAFT_1633729 [Ramaria rubella]
MIRFLPLPHIIFSFPFDLVTLPWSPAKCLQLFRLTTSLENVARGSITAVLVLRTYAIYERNVKVLIGLGFIGLTAVALNFVPMMASTCNEIGTSPVLLRMEVFSISSRVVFEVTLVVLTIMRTVHTFQRQENRMLLEGANLESLILRSGLLSFFPALILETLSLVSLFSNSGSLGIMNEFTLPLSAIIIAHFLLDLRTYADNPCSEARTLSIFRVDPPSRALTSFGQEFGDEVLGGYNQEGSSQ